MGTPWFRRPWVLPAGLCLAAVAIRALYLWQAAANPTFDAPMIDAARYDALARGVLASGRLEADLFWQPSFYPLWLALVYRILGPSLLAAKLLQVALAGLTCFLTWRLGARLGGRKAGAIAAGIYALYGPAIFFEGELLATGVATLLAVAVPLAALRAVEDRRGPWWLGAGLASGVAIWCRPVFVPVVLLIATWLLLRLWPRREPAPADAGEPAEGTAQRRVAGATASPHLSPLPSPRRRLVLGALFAAGLGAVLAPVATLAHRHTGRATVLPYSGGLNLWLGNAPDLCATLTVRPGDRWRTLVDEPARAAGALGPSAQQEYFLAKTGALARRDPGTFAANLGRKALRLAASREVPRNVDVYAARSYSLVLSALTWRLGPFGFPFGLLLPLAVLGLVVAHRQVPAPIWLTLLGLALVLVAVFPAARYRMPMVPLLAPLAALGAVALVRAAKERRWRALVPGAALAVVALGLGTLPGRFCEEWGDYRAELHLGAGVHHERRGDLERARKEYARAVALAPRLYEAQVNLGVVLHRLGAREEALARFDAGVALAPKSAAARLGRALVLVDLDRIADAATELREVIRLAPRQPSHRFLLGQILARARRFREAEAAFRAADRIRPDDPETLNALAWLASGQDDPALTRPAEAVRLAMRACALTGFQDPSLLDTLGVAHLSAGHLTLARQRFAEALKLARRRGQHGLARDIAARLRALEGAP